MERSEQRKEINKDNTSTKQPLVFDLEQLTELMGGDTAFVSELIVLYMEEVPLRIERFIAHCEQEEAHAARLEIHSVKGSSATIGANQMSAIAWDLEQRLRNNEPTTSLTESIAILQSTYEKTKTAMLAALQSI